MSFSVISGHHISEWWLVWWGAVRVEGTDNFVWYTTRQPVYGTWHSGEPNGKNSNPVENCMMMGVKSNTYFDIACADYIYPTLPYVCEFQNL